MGKQVFLKKRLMFIFAVIIMVFIGCFGCAQRPGRVYKIAYPPSRASQVNASSMSDGQYESPYNMEKPSGGQNNPQMDVGMDVGQVAAESDQGKLYVAGDEYHIGAGDILEVKIFQLLEPDREELLVCEVDRNGEIYLPLLNHVKAAGMTTEQLRKALVGSLGREFIREPKVNVSVKEYRSKAVMVMGRFKNPGEKYLKSDTSTLLDVIAMAGEISSGAAPDIEILRGEYDPSGTLGSNTKQLPVRREVVPVSELFAEEGRGQINPVIYAGDVVKIRSADEGYIYFSGEVVSPGEKSFRNPMTILQALSRVGGVTNIAAEKKCKIIRQQADGVEKEIIVNLKKIHEGKQENLLIARNDTIMVPADSVKKFFDGLNRLVKRGVMTGVDLTYSASSAMGLPSSQISRAGAY
jgi:polysaccharide export outer membrane protein